MKVESSLSCAGLTVAIGLACSVSAAAGLEIPIPGKAAVVKSGKLVKVVAKNKPIAPATFPLPAPGSAEDPTSAGADLRFFDTLGAGGDVTFSLDASGWRGLGNPAGSKGYKYKGKSDTSVSKAPCAVVLLKEKVIKATCKGPLVTLAPPFSGAESILLGMPAGSASRVYCAEFGGDEKKNATGLMKRKDAPAPASCTLEPSLPSSLLDPADVAELADDVMLGRDNGTSGSLMAQAMIIRELKELGAAGFNSAMTGDNAYLQGFASGTNVLGIITGSELPNEYVFVGAHYDHLGTSCGGDGICNGATDNAAGVAATLAIGRAVAVLPGGPRRSVVLALWDREEDGLLGSKFYVNNPLVPLASTIAYINFDIQGANLLPSIRNTSFAVGSETGGATLQAQVSAAVAGSSLGTGLLSNIFGQGRSDYVNFVNHGVPTVFFSDSTGGCYHTADDELAVVDFAKLEKQTAIATTLALDLISTDTLPTFVSPNPVALAVYNDAVVIDAAVQLALADAGLFNAADQATLTNLAADIHALVVAGQANFDSTDVPTLLVSASSLINLLTQTACNGYLP